MEVTEKQKAALEFDLSYGGDHSLSGFMDEMKKHVMSSSILGIPKRLLDGSLEGRAESPGEEG